MADWYCGSVEWTAVTAWAAGTSYIIGDIRRQLAAPTVGNERVWRCTTAGTSGGSEPVWTLTKASTTADNTAVWTEVTGNSTYNWTAPHARLKSANAWTAAGDTIYVAEDHAETQSTAMAIAFSGTEALPLRVICVNHSGTVPPVSADLRTTATVTTTGATNIGMSGVVYCYGVIFKPGTGSSTLNPSGVRQVYASCGFNFAGTGSLSIANTPGFVDWYNVTLTTASTANTIGPAQSNWNGGFRWFGGSLAGAAVPTNLMSSTSCGVARLDGVDLSAAGSGKTIVPAVSTGHLEVTLNNCKLGASVTVAATATSTCQRTYLVNSDSSTQQCRQELYSYSGTLTTETTNIRAAGATDGTTPISWKVITTANASRSLPFEAFEIATFNAATGSAKTVSVEILNDGTTLTNADVWMEAYYLGSSAAPLASTVTSGADALATGTNITTSSASWTTTGITTPIKQTVSVSITPQMVDDVRVIMKVGKASKTLWIDPLVSIT